MKSFYASEVNSLFSKILNTHRYPTAIYNLKKSKNH